MTGQIAIMGAGAVGCFYGGKLASSGEAVTLIGRQALVDAVKESGLLIDDAQGREIITLNASSDPAAVEGADLVLFSVKSGDTEAAGREIAPYLSPDAVILSLQNGVGNAERLTKVLGRPVIGVVVYVAVEMAGPAHVLHKGRGELILSPGPGAEAAAARLSNAGIKAEVSENAESALWAKFTVNCCLNAASALTLKTYGEIIATDGAEAFLRDVFEECDSVAKASGITLPADLWENVLGITQSMKDQRSSTAQDLIRGKPSEIDYLNGEITRRAKALGLKTPLNNALWLLTRLAEAKPKS